MFHSKKNENKSEEKEKKNDSPFAPLEKDTEKKIHTMADDLGGNSEEGKSDGSVSSVPSPFISQGNNQETKGDTVNKNKIIESETAENDMAKNKKDKTSKKLPFIILAILILVLFILGGIYFYMANEKEESVSGFDNLEKGSIPIEESVEKTVDMIDQEVKNSKYSSDDINYIAVDVETYNQETIEGILIKTTEDVSQVEGGEIYEFKITDSNENPLAFTRFAHLFNLNLEEEVLSSLEEDFSIFIQGGGQKRVVMAMKIADSSQIKDLLNQSESNLVKAVESLFLGEMITKNNGFFGSSIYKDNTIRYINLNEGKTLSVDYAISGGYLILGTNKALTRRVLDRF